MAFWRQNPLIYEINAWTWLYSLSTLYNRPGTFGSIPDEVLAQLAQWKLDAVWLMGVWERSPAGREISLGHPHLQDEYRRALPHYTEADVVGSPYAIRRYEVDPHLGERNELAALRKRLEKLGIKLVLDFVPNHTAIDCPWLTEYPDYFVQGTSEDLETRPEFFFTVPGGEGRSLIFSNGRDPYFPAWTDTAQVNAFNPHLRNQIVATLLDIASMCDAVRCDMAMLVTNRIFSQTWGPRVGPEPETEYWHVIIPAIKAKYPHFLFLAEVYWDMEWKLQQQGFDYTYDKRLYDYLKNEPVRSILTHLQGDLNYQSHMVRFIENHDEQRAARTFGPGRDQAAAVLVTTLPGATLLHEGQFYGYRIKLPVQLGHRPAEDTDPEIEAFYRLLLAEVSKPIYHNGTWHIRETLPAWDLNATHKNLIAYMWQSNSSDRRLIVINYSSTGSQGRVLLPDLEAERTWKLQDQLDGSVYERPGKEMADAGLYVDLRPWQSHIFDFR